MNRGPSNDYPLWIARSVVFRWERPTVVRERSQCPGAPGDGDLLYFSSKPRTCQQFKPPNRATVSLLGGPKTENAGYSLKLFIAD
jgi:hypothetical protein